MWSQVLRLQVSVIALLMVFLTSAPAPGTAQTLHVERLAGGTELVFVTQPLSAATTLSWPGDGEVRSLTRGELNLVSDAERALADVDPAPPVVIAVGGSQMAELMAMLERVLAGRRTAPVPEPDPAPSEGGVDRRLGTPGGRAQVRLEVPLPTPDDVLRSSAEVLWELVPSAVDPQLEGLRGRIEGEIARLEGEVEPDLADLELRRIRLALARLGHSQRLDESSVAAARTRVEVRRKALLGTHPEAAEMLVSRWLVGGLEAVRHELFGIDGVTVESVRSAADRWLANHPGRAVLMLPPQFFNPRFARGPEIIQLDNDVMAAVLERPGAGLSAINLRPVLLPDVDGQVTATVLARLAARLRASEIGPGWIRVLEDPPALELAGPPDGLPEMMEVLQGALGVVAEDDLTVALEGGDARRRALQLMARLLGLSEGAAMSPAVLLRPGNLAVGVVSPDAETALEAMTKFGLGGTAAAESFVGRSVQPMPRTREAAAGSDSVLVVALEPPRPTGDLATRAAAEVVVERALGLAVADEVTALHPVVPGRRVALVVLRADGELQELERRAQRAWPKLMAPVGEDELAAARRLLAAAAAARASGPLGRARLCAAAAAGDVGWRNPSDLELEIVTLSEEQIDDVLSGLAGWDEVATTGAGVMPVPGIGGSAS